MLPENNSDVVEELLLPQRKTISSDNKSLQIFNRKKCSVLGITIAVLLICGVIAYGLTAAFFYFFEDKLFSLETSTSTLPPTHIKPYYEKSTSLLPASACDKRIVGYFLNWGSREISKSQLSKLTHIIYSGAALDSNGTISFQSNNNRRAFLDMRNHARHSNSTVKVMITIGGSKYSKHFSQIADDKRENFTSSIISFIQTYKIDGVDIYWDWPDSGGKDKENYVFLTKELREKLTELQTSEARPQPYLLTVLTPSFDWSLEEGVDLEGLSNYVDFFNIASDDYTVSSSTKLGSYTKPHAPLYSGSGEKMKHNVDWTMRYYTCKLKNSRKLNMGLPFFGRYWQNVGNQIVDSDEMWRYVNRINGSAVNKLVLWRNLKNEGWNITNAKWDEKTKSSYIWNPDEKTFLGFDDERSLREKMKYVKEKNLGGVMIWSVEMDDYSDTLLNAVASVDICENGKGNEKKDELKFNCN